MFCFCLLDFFVFVFVCFLVVVRLEILKLFIIDAFHCKFVCDGLSTIMLTGLGAEAGAEEGLWICGGAFVCADAGLGRGGWGGGGRGRGSCTSKHGSTRPVCANHPYCRVHLQPARNSLFQETQSLSFSAVTSTPSLPSSLSHPHPRLRHNISVLCSVSSNDMPRLVMVIAAIAREAFCLTILVCMG